MSTNGTIGKIHRYREKARTLLLHAQDLHDELCNEPNCQDAAGVAAWIAHSLGITTTELINRMEAELERYNAECPGCTARN